MQDAKNMYRKTFSQKMVTAYRMLGHLTRCRQGTTTRKHNLKNLASSKSRVRKRDKGIFFRCGGWVHKCVHTPVLSSKFSHTTLTLTQTRGQGGGHFVSATEDALSVPPEDILPLKRPVLEDLSEDLLQDLVMTN
jgi:hypothetical protein